MPTVLRLLRFVKDTTSQVWWHAVRSVLYFGAYKLLVGRGNTVSCLTGSLHVRLTNENSVLRFAKLLEILRADHMKT